MRKRSRESLPGIFTPVLTAPLLAGIHELNRDYVELLIGEQAGQISTSLPLSVINGLAALPPTARAALAACPFALYSLGLEQQDAWRVSLSTAETAPVRYPSCHALSAGSVFAINALYFAWHVAHVQPVAARMFYAMPDFAIDGLMRKSLVDLQCIARNTTGLLLPRWPANTAFWPDLIRFAKLGDERRLNMTQLHGSQLISVDLRVNAQPRSMLRTPVGALREARLK